MEKAARWILARQVLVRDLISGMPIRDLDFTIEGNPSRIVRELEKGGAEVTNEVDALRTAELILAGEVDASVSAAREEVYARPGAKFEVRYFDAQMVRC